MLVVLGSGSASIGCSATSGAGRRMRFIRGARRRSTMYVRSLREGFGCSSSIEYESGGVRTRGCRRRTSEVIEDDCCSDFSYASVSSSNRKTKMRVSSRRRCILEGAYSIPTKSNTTVRPSTVPSRACNQKLGKLRKKVSKNHDRRETLGSISLGL